MGKIKIIGFDWDHGKDDDYNGLSFNAGIFLPNKVDDFELGPSIPYYGISMEISKFDDLHLMSCSAANLVGEVKSMTREQIRERFILELDKSLDILFDESKHESIMERLNIAKEDEEK